MLLRTQLKDVAETHTNGNMGYAEKLYLQDIILHSIYQKTTDELVFKGGTCLLKLYNLDRFSEDLDFTLNDKELDIGEIIDDSIRHLEKFGAEVEENGTRETQDSYKTRLGIKGPLYQGTRLSLSFVRIEVNKKARAENPVNKRYSPVFPDVPAFNLMALSQEEILSEKIRAIVTRARPRDLYDVYHLLKKNVKIKRDLTGRKLDYYDLEFEKDKVMEEAKKLEKGWEDVSTLTFSDPPAFHEAIETLKDGLNSV